jgi:hypothetical protein
MSPKRSTMRRAFAFGAAALVTALAGMADAHATVIGVSLNRVTNFQFFVSDPSVTFRPGDTTATGATSFNGPTVNNVVNCGPGGDHAHAAVQPGRPQCQRAPGDGRAWAVSCGRHLYDALGWRIRRLPR